MALFGFQLIGQALVFERHALECHPCAGSRRDRGLFATEPFEGTV